MIEEVEDLQERFSNVVAFEDEEIDQACNRWKDSLINKLMDKGLSLDFV